MKYQYRIVDRNDPKVIHHKSEDVATNELAFEFAGFDTHLGAQQAAEQRMQLYALSPGRWNIVIVPKPETVVEEDKLDGHAYPGHEVWPDDAWTEDERDLGTLQDFT